MMDNLFSMIFCVCLPGIMENSVNCCGKVTEFYYQIYAGTLQAVSTVHSNMHVSVSRVHVFSLRSQVRVIRVQVEETRRSLESSRSRGNVLEALMQLKHSGTLPGVIGRLVGDSSLGGGGRGAGGAMSCDRSFPTFCYFFPVLVFFLKFPSYSYLLGVFLHFKFCCENQNAAKLKNATNLKMPYISRCHKHATLFLLFPSVSYFYSSCLIFEVLFFHLVKGKAKDKCPKQNWLQNELAIV